MTTYRTTDIILAACLRINGYDLADIELVGTKGTFCFVEVDEHFIQDYDLGKCRVEPVAFNNAIKQLTTSVRRMMKN
jgi:hypothetical protein